MTKYSATFADGKTITRTTTRQYAVAWRARWISKQDGVSYDLTGFAVSPERANPYRPAPYWAGRNLSPAERAAKRKLNAEYCEACGYQVEFAPAVVEV